jgi:fucose permease
MFGFGIVMALLGAILPLLVSRLHFDLSEAGGLFLAMSAAMLVTTLLLGPVLDHFGIRSTMIVAPLFVAVAVALIAGVSSSQILVLGVILLGAGGGALNQATNTLIADLHEDSRAKNAALNTLGVFFGFGALFIPFTIGSLLTSLGMRNILYCAIPLILIPTALSIALPYPAPKHAGSIRLRNVIQLASRPLVLAFACLLFFESGNEFTLGGYLSTYLTRDLQSPVTLASYALAGYWGALMIARVILGRVLLKVGGELLIRWSAIAVACCVVALALARGPLLAAALEVLLGFCMAAIFPTVLGVAGTRHHGDLGTLFGILIGIALIGGMTVPWLAGQVANQHGVRAALWIPAAGAIAILLCQLLAERLAKKTESATASANQS